MNTTTTTTTTPTMTTAYAERLDEAIRELAAARAAAYLQRHKADVSRDAPPVFRSDVLAEMFLYTPRG